jgi:hypothetical protein
MSDPEALVKAALERAAGVAQRWWDDPSMLASIRALASDPAAVAQIIEQAKGKADDRPE